jgi:DNA polymerase-3 subunit alpha
MKNLQYFKTILMNGWKERVVDEGKDLAVYQERLQYEIGVVTKLKLVNYFLIVYDSLEWSRKNNILIGVGRGSSSGSLICYLMGITQLDPIVHGLFFERFLNVNRADMADIDIDVQDDRRAELFAYLRRKYGYDKTSQIGTFGYLSVVSAFRDVCSVMEIPSYQINELSKMIVDETSFDEVPELRNFARAYPEIIKHAKKLDGVIRNVGTHAAGLVISSHPIEEVAVIEHRKDSEVCNWDKKTAEAFGLLKMDFLGLSTLTVLNRAKDLIKNTRGVDIDLYKIPLDDELTIKEFQAGNSIGIFQFEKGFVQDVLRSTQPKSLDQLAQITALCRPGPMTAVVSGTTTMLQQYVKVASGSAYPNYEHELLRDILESTKSVMVYQEQIMKIFQVLANFSLAEADEMRKIIGRKMDAEAFEPYKDKFVNGCKKNDINPELSSHLFEEIKKFAGYGFAKSHAVAYAYNSFSSMYLKVHFPVEYMASLLSFTTKRSNIPLYIRECDRLEIEVIMPDINLSTDEFNVVDGKIVAPLSAIKGVGDASVKEILMVRGDGFTSVDDLVSRVAKKQVNKGKVETLIKAGAFASLGVVETDQDILHQEMSQLLDIFNKLPSFDMENKIELDILNVVMSRAEACSNANKMDFMGPVHGKHATVMVINKPSASEKQHLTGKLTSTILDKLRENGITKGKIYYTGGYKCKSTNDKNEFPQFCQDTCPAILHDEIVSIKPKLILLCDSRLQGMFLNPKLKWYEIIGNVYYVPKFETYVIPSFTPQQVAYRGDEEMTDKFNEICEKIGHIFS